MARFCRHCGNPVEDGQVCSCAGAQREWQATAPQQPQYQQPQQPQYQQAPVYTAAPQQPQYQQPQYQQPVQPKAPSTLVPELKDVLTTGLKAPRQAGPKILASSNKMALAGILAAINGIAIFLLLWSSMTSILNAILGIMGGSLGSLLGEIDMTLPIFPMLLGGILLAAVAIAASATVILVCGKLSNCNMNFVDCMALAAVDSLYPTVAVLLTALLGFIGIAAQLIGIALLLVVAIVNTLDTVRNHTGLQIGASLKNYLVSVVCILAAIVVIAYIGKLIAIDWCVYSIEIEGVKLGDAIDAMSSYGGLLG